MSDTGPSARRILTGVACGGAVVLPLLLLLDPAAFLTGDGSNHLWMIRYYAEYFRAHGSLPAAINVPAVGLAQPVFYAWLLYPLLGVLAAGVGPTLALQLAVLTMLAIQFFALLSAGQKILGDTRLAYTMAVSVIWATYSLTNLYNRGALAEYFATGFFSSALAFATHAVVADDRSSRWFHGWLAGLCLILTVGTHAPTAILAAVFLTFLAIGGILGARRSAWRAITGRSGLLAAGALAAGVMVLAPWIYASSRFAAKLSLVRGGAALIYRPENCDSFWGRFAPFPYDAAAVENGIYGLGTAYLEAPINVVLLGILLGNVLLWWRSRASAPTPAPFRGWMILFVACSWFLLLVVVSLSPTVGATFHSIAPYVQYAYRLVSHCNAALLIAVFASGAWLAQRGVYRRFQRETDIIASVCLTIAVLGLGIKLQHAAVVITPVNANVTASMNRRLQEVVPDYTVPASVRELTEAELKASSEIAFLAGDAARFGELSPVNIQLKDAHWLQTNAVVFPWTILEIDGKIARADQLARAGPFLAVFLPAGSHEVHAVWQPDTTWLLLHRVSQGLFVLLVLVTLVWSAARGWAALAVGAAADASSAA